MSTVVVKPPATKTVVVRRSGSPTVVNRSVIKETTTQDDGTETVVSRQVVRTAVSRPAAQRTVVKKEVSSGTAVQATGPRIMQVTSATPGATLASLEPDGFAYWGLEANNDSSAVTSSTWQIYRVPSSSLGDSPVYAGGVEAFTHRWDQRTTLSYP